MKIDLNCDLGEGEPPDQTRELMRWISSANVACGGHAGDAESMRLCVRLANEFDVNLGAHPGPWDRANMGRGEISIAAAELASLLVEQIGAMADIARAEGGELHHVKLHGALYREVEQSNELADTYVRIVHEQWRGLRIIGFAGGHVVSVAKELGTPVWEEAFADRAYQENGQLLSRDLPNALLRDSGAVIDRVRSLTTGDDISSYCGASLKIRCDTVCVHSDTPNAVDVVQQLSQLLRGS